MHLSLRLCKQAESAKEAQLQGPITFPQERLLSYFWNLLRTEGTDDEESAWDERLAQQQQSAEVFMLLRSLVSLRLLSQASRLLLAGSKHPLALYKHSPLGVVRVQGRPNL